RSKNRNYRTDVRVRTYAQRRNGVYAGHMATKKKSSVGRDAPPKPATAPQGAKPTPKEPRVFAMSFASVYVLYVQKAEKKGRTQQEVDEVIAWLTGYQGQSLQRALDTKVDLKTFLTAAPRWNPKTELVTGVVCGVRVEEVADPLMRKIRVLDKLVDELARGKKMESILRS